MLRTFRVLLAMLLLALAMMWAIPGRAQNTADLSGTVTDPSGAALKGVNVTVTLLSTGASRSTTTNDTGYYSFVQLPPGHYKVTVDAGEHFDVRENPDLELTVGAAA